MSIQNILSGLDASRDAREALYKHFHRNPELSLQEYRTAERIEEELGASGIGEVLRIGKTGVVAILRNGEGPVVAMRGDTDALPADRMCLLPGRLFLNNLTRGSSPPFTQIAVRSPSSPTRSRSSFL